MKYFRVNETDASGLGLDFWEYFALQECSMSDEDLLDEAISLFEENNSWVFNLDCRRNKAEQITEEQYKTGLLFNKMYEFKHEDNKIRTHYNLYPTKDMAILFADKNHKSGLVRIGYPNLHNVYKFNQDGNLVFMYFYDSDKFGQLNLNV